MALKTPTTILTDIFVTDSNQNGQAGILVPLNISGKQIKGKLQIHCDSMKEVSDLKKILFQQPKATYRGAYSLAITIFCPLENELASFTEDFALDAYAAVMQMISPSDMKVEWFI